MFTEKKYRAKSKEYGDLIKGSNDAGQIRKLQDSKDSFSSLADNEEWLANKFDKMVQVPAEEQPGHHPCRRRRACSSLPGRCRHHAVEHAAGETAARAFRHRRIDG